MRVTTTGDRAPKVYEEIIRNNPERYRGIQVLGNFAPEDEVRFDLDARERFKSAEGDDS